MWPKGTPPFMKKYTLHIDANMENEEYLQLLSTLLKQAFEDANVHFDNVENPDEDQSVDDIMTALDMMDASVEGDDHPEALALINHAYKNYNGSNQ